MLSFIINLVYPITGKRIKVINQKNIPLNQPFIMVFNHNSFLDGPFFFTWFYKNLRIKLHFLVYKWLWQWWGGHWLAPFFGYILFSGKKAESRQAAVLKGIEILKAGKSIALAPEGHINLNPKELLKGKTGAVRMALAARVPLLPAGWLSPAAYFRPGLKIFFNPHSLFELKIGRPVYLTEFYEQEITKELLETATRKIMKAVGELCGKKYSF